jgi:hypothetical protein
MKIVTCSFFVLFCLHTLTGAGFDNEYNKAARNEIKRLKICGERCSGTNFVDYLLQRNFPTIQPVDLLEYGSKHFLWWFGTPFDPHKLSRLTYDSSAITFSQSHDCLFVVVVRKPYDWLRSFYLNPHFVHPTLLTQGFSHFIRSEWRLSSEYQPPDGQYDEIDNYNPWTHKPFANVLQLRQYKMRNYLILRELVDNYLFVRYEDVRDNPKGFIDFVATYFHLEKNREFIPITTQKGSHVPYVENKYFPIELEDLAFINKEIDWWIEEKIGYSMQPI